MQLADDGESKLAYLAAVPERFPPRLLYLDQFSSPQEAMTLIERDDGFDNVVGPILTEAVAAMRGPTMLLAFCLSAITRARGLYEGVVREMLTSKSSGGLRAIETTCRNGCSR